MTVLVSLALLHQVACNSVVEACAGPAADAVESVPEATTESWCGLPLCGPLGSRLYCIEGYESGHDGGARNHRSGAAGWLQWLPSTARKWDVVIGDRWSEWTVAARIAAQGAAFFNSQWVPLQLGWC
jgi:hypothetical protein